MLRFTFIYFRCFPFGPVSSSTFDSVACVCIVAVAAIGATVYLRWGGIFAVVYCVQHQALFHYFLYCCFFIYFSRETTTQVHVAHEILVRVRFSALSGFSLLALYGCVCVCVCVPKVKWVLQVKCVERKICVHFHFVCILFFHSIFHITVLFRR